MANFEVPILIYTLPTKAVWKAQYTDGFIAKLAYQTAVKIYWKTKLGEEQNWRCCWCGIRMLDEPGHKKSSTIEHIVPRSLGGKNKPDNYAVACYTCNNKRGVKDVDEFMAEINALHEFGNIRYASERELVEYLTVRVQEKLESLAINSNILTIATTSSRLHKQLDILDAIAAIKDGITNNPFPPNTRIWKLYQKYSNPTTYIYRAIFHHENNKAELGSLQAMIKVNNRSKPLDNEPIRSMLAEELRSKGIIVSNNARKGRLKRRIDAAEAIAALHSGKSNPFEYNSRRWKFFERYLFTFKRYGYDNTLNYNANMVRWGKLLYLEKTTISTELEEIAA